MKIIGLGHVSRTGKDSLANYLLLALKCRKITAVKRPFAWKMKHICYELYAWAGHKEPEWYDTQQGEQDRDLILPALGMTPVQLWCKFGTLAGREVYPLTWVHYAVNTPCDAEVLVCSDVRFPNEVQAIHEKGGVLVKVVRPGYGPETEIDKTLEDYDGWDAVVGQSGKMADLQSYARNLADWLKYGGDMPKE